MEFVEFTLIHTSTEHRGHCDVGSIIFAKDPNLRSWPLVVIKNSTALPQV